MAEIQVILSAPLEVDDALVDVVADALESGYDEREARGEGTTDHDAARDAIAAVFAATWQFDTLVAATKQMLDTWYPAEVFDGSSSDPGPRLIAALRDVLAVREGTATVGSDTVSSPSGRGGGL